MAGKNVQGHHEIPRQNLLGGVKRLKTTRYSPSKTIWRGISHPRDLSRSAMHSSEFFGCLAFPSFEEVAEIIGIVVADVHRNGGQLIIRPGQQLLGMLQAAFGQEVDESLP